MGDVNFLPHQREAIDRLRSGSILCGGVGTGKSITALGFFFEKICRCVQWSDGKQRGPLLSSTPLYIITTARKRDTREWEKEIERFGYDVELVIDSWNNMHKYADVKDAFFILDEQRLVGSGKWVREFYLIAMNNRWILLSATPGDTWEDYIPVFVANGFYRNRTQFLRRHAVYSRYVTRYPKIERWVDTATLERYRRQIVVVMRYERNTVPHWHEIAMEYDHELYRKIAEERFDPWKEEPIMDISGVCRLLRRVTSGEAENGVNARAMRVWRLCVEEHPKLIVFYNYDYELAAMREAFGQAEKRRLYSGAKPEVAEWNGHRHEPIPDSKRWIYLVQYAAGCEGWNCTRTDTIIFYSQSYSYKQMVQAAGRIDRLNTPYTDLHYYVFKTDSSIDRAIDKALRGKKTFNEKLFAKTAGIRE